MIKFFKPLAKLEDIEENSVKVVETKFCRVGITRQGEKILVFEDVCSHDGESIASGKLNSCIITCPRHLAQFDLNTGEPLCMPATSPIQIFTTRIQNGWIEVELEE